MQIQKNKTLLVGSLIALVFFVIGMTLSFSFLIGMPLIKGFQSLIYSPVFITVGFAILLIAQLKARKETNK